VACPSGAERGGFGRGDWDEANSTFETMKGIKLNRATKLEATCLAVRALAAGKQRSAARHLLKSVENGEYKKPVHFEFLAHAYLDLKQYKEAAVACERAEALRISELN
jgi:hypothetical protein